MNEPIDVAQQESKSNSFQSCSAQEQKEVLKVGSRSAGCLPWPHALLPPAHQEKWASKRVPTLL